jgi:hypothetical protein
MPFDPSGLPTLPTCESDISRWSADLQTWLVQKLSVAHGEIDAVSVDPFDICAELGNLSAPTCLVPATGVDQTGFTYASEGDLLAAGSGVLPWPGSVLGAISPIQAIRRGNWSGTAAANWTATTIAFSPAVDSTSYVIVVEQKLTNKFTWAVQSKTTSSFVLQVCSLEVDAIGPVASSMNLDWALLYMPT